MKKILLIDDDMDMCLLLNRFLSREGYVVTEAHSGKQAITYLDGALPDLIISDLQLGDMDGIAVLKHVKEKKSDIPFIIITGYSDITTSMNAIKLGAFDYVAKPLLTNEMLVTIKRAFTEKQSVEGTKKGKKSESKSITYIDGDTESFRKIRKQIELVAPTEHNVIIYGESGSGKEMVAHEIHKGSKRSDGAFVTINCNTLSKEWESIFSGNENEGTKGKLLIANNGSLFLDDVTSLPQPAQRFLLQVLQSGRIRRENRKDQEIDIRILMSSNENVWSAVRKGKFNDELYFILNDFNINLPSLRERKDDIMFFANHFLKQLKSTEPGISVKAFAPETEEILQTYKWPGNLHELKNVVNKASLLATGDNILPANLPDELTKQENNRFPVS